ncbi:hypothetical protein [Rhodococcus sp. IEGM1428]
MTRERQSLLLWSGDGQVVEDDLAVTTVGSVDQRSGQAVSNV